MNKLEKIIERLSEKKAGLSLWIISLLGVIFVRCFIEQFLASSKSISIQETVVEYWHNFYFFSLAIILIWIFLSLLTKTKPEELSGFMIYSLFLTLIPPLIDMAKTGGEIYWSFYLLSSPSELFKQYLTVFGNLPSGIVYFGTKITFLIAIFLSAGFVWIKTKKIIKSAASAIIVYSILFFMGSFPTLFFYIYSFIFESKKILQIHSFEIAQFFGSPEKIFGVDFPSFKYTLAYRLNLIYYLFFIFLLIVFFRMINREKFFAVLKNLRFPQIIYHSGLFFIGIGLGILNYSDNFHLNLFSILSVIVLIVSVWLSWKASVIINDLNDFEIDKISNSQRPLPKKIFTREEYGQLGIACFILGVLGGLTIGFTFAILLLVYQIIAWLYSAEPFRLKKIPIVATFLSSFASLMVLFSGYILLSDNQTIHTLSWRIILLIMITYTISLPIKDFKDIEGDKADGVWTIPVILGEKKGRLIVAISIFSSYILSVFFLNELSLFFWALLFGTATFLVVVNEKIKPRKLPSWVLGIVSIYTLILAKIVFI